MISVHFQGKPFNITVIQVYTPNNNAEEAEDEWFYEDLQDFLELTPPKMSFSLKGTGMGKSKAKNVRAKVRSQEIPGVIIEVQKEAEQRLIEFYQENSLVIENTFF